MTLTGLEIQNQLRVESLEEYNIIDTETELLYDNITDLASKICETPISLISFLDKDRVWLKSNHGVETREVPKEHAFCNYAITGNEDVFIVNDSRTDSRLKNSLAVKYDPSIIFYAGIPLYDDNNVSLGALCIIDDKPKELSADQITSLKILANQVMALLKSRKQTTCLYQSVLKLNENNKKLEKFAYVVAHDLKSPLINISAISKHLSGHYTSDLDDDGKKLLSLIEQSSSELENNIEDILKYYKEDIEIQEKQSVINVKEFYSEFVELFKDESYLKIDLNTVFEEILSYKNVLKEIISNLISNSIRYHDKKEMLIEIGISENIRFYEFYIKDNGSGIPLHLHDKIFDLFMIGHNTDKKGKKGKGIGLAKTQRFIERLGGSIKVENNELDGCTFTFKIRK